MQKPVVVILAAGRGERFLSSGGKTPKLDALLGGVPVLEYVLRATRASGLPWHVVRPADDTRGMGDSIAKGIRATAGAPGWLILPADLPLVRPDTLALVAAGLASHRVVVPHDCGTRGHPVGFAAECFDALAALSGDAGAAHIVRECRRAGLALDLEVDDAGIHRDVDTVQDLDRVEAWLNALGGGARKA
ncbi:MAG: nucleotidyltransferase family protein [Bordetella sp.]|uniref:nucleotidyltransferase family protein n=1 Tax=Bordetella sp. TaxID=28081 RepID=UPI003F7CC2D3